MSNEAETNIEITENFIDIDGVFKNKNPKLHKFIPRFIINYLKRVLHEDVINQAIWRNRNKWGLDFVEAIIKEFGANIQIKNLENVPKEGRYLVASNHPLGGLDGIALMHVVGRVREDIVFPVNDLLLNLPNLKQLFIPINKHGSNTENIRIINETYESDQAMLYFPAGLVSRKQKGIIKDVPWSKSFLTKSKRYKRDIIPTHIDGRNSNFFYNLANLRKRSGLKANIEMLYLVDEMYKQYNKDVNIVFGKPIPIPYFDKRHRDIDWAALLRDYVYFLGENGSKTFEEWHDEKHKQQ